MKLINNIFKSYVDYFKPSVSPKFLVSVEDWESLGFYVDINTLKLVDKNNPLEYWTGYYTEIDGVRVPISVDISTKLKPKDI